MTLENMKTEESFALITNAGIMAYTSNNLELIKARRAKVNPSWCIVRIITTYEKISA